MGKAVTWTPAMKSDLARMWPDPMMYVAGILGHFQRVHGVAPTERAMRQKASLMGLHRPRHKGPRTTLGMGHPADRIIASGFQAGQDDRAIADQVLADLGLRLSREQVRHRRSKLGLRRYRKTRWTQPACVILRRMREEGYGAADIAARINAETSMKVTAAQVVDKVKNAGETWLDSTNDPTMADMAREVGLLPTTLGLHIARRMKVDPLYRTVYGTGRYRRIPRGVQERIRQEFPLPDGPVMTTKAAAKALHFGLTATKAKINDGTLQGIKRGGRLYVYVSSVETYRQQMGITRPLPQTFGVGLAKVCVTSGRQAVAV